MNIELFCPLSASLRSFLVSDRLVAAILDLYNFRAGGEVTYAWKWGRKDSKNFRFAGNKNKRQIKCLVTYSN